MRMWNLETNKMCDRHLLGEHVETHMMVGCLNKGKSVQGYINKGLIEIHNVKNRHEELAREMKSRGFTHKSKLPEYQKIKLGQININKNKLELRNRCKECKKNGI